MSMLRTLVKVARPGLTCVQVRNIRAKPVYWHPADPDPDEEQRLAELTEAYSLFFCKLCLKDIKTVIIKLKAWLCCRS